MNISIYLLWCAKFKGLYPVRWGSFLEPNAAPAAGFLVSSKENCFWKKNPSALLELLANQNDDVWWWCWLWWCRKELWLVQRERRLVNAEKEFISRRILNRKKCHVTRKSIPIRYSTQLEYIFLWIRLRTRTKKKSKTDLYFIIIFCQRERHKKKTERPGTV